jgi:iron complex outermembrane receptor protein
MSTSKSIRRAVQWALWTGAASVAAVQSVHAQEGEAIQEVVVTGSRISSPNMVSISPVTSVSSEDIKIQGLTRVEDIMNRLPQVFAAQGSTVSNGADGTATVNLRGLGSNRTLVLVNGRRLGPGDPNSSTFAADLNQVPAALVERVEVLTGGASSVYGADAVAGVVNFIMNTKFEGVRVEANYGFYNHKNDNAVASIVRDNGFFAPSDTVNTGYSKDFAIVMGSNFAEDRGNATFYATYRDVDPVLQGEYDYSSCTLDSGDTFSCGGSGTAYPARFRPVNSSGNIVGSYTLDENTGALIPGSAPAYNFGPLNYYQRPDERYTAGVFASLEMSEKAEVYGEFMFMRDTSVSQIAPSGVFGDTFTVSCSNPLWTAAQFDAFCGSQGLTAADDVGIIINRRNTEGGGRQQELQHTSYRTVFGIRGDINETWSYDAYGQYGTTSADSVYMADLSITRTGRALDVVDDGSGNPVCRSVLNGTDPTCVPYNIWSLNGVTPEALAYVQNPLLARGSVDERVVNASVTGDLTNYGVKLPSADSGVIVNIGLEWREEKSAFLPDGSYQTGDGAGQGGATLPLSGGYRVKELFTEARIPLVSGAAFADSLSAEVGYRYSDYSTDWNTDTYKFGLEWSPIQDVRLRASYQNAVRVPNVADLFSVQQVGLRGTVDPCAGPNPGLTFEQCARTGVGPTVPDPDGDGPLTGSGYGFIEANPAAQYNGFIGGNPNVEPETAKTLSFGIALQPSFAPGLRFQVDYFDIKIEDPIQSPNADFTLLLCALNGDPALCSKIQRDQNQSLWFSDGGFVVDTLENIGQLRTKGFDFDASYNFGIGNLGEMQLAFTGTLLDSYEVTPQPGVTYDCAGLYGSVCTSGDPNGAPLAEWKHKMSATWNTPWSGLSVTLGWRYIDEVKRDAEDSNPFLAFLGTATGALPTDARLGSRSYIDLSAAMSLGERYTLRVGANNLFDKDPPLNGSTTCPSGPCNGNTWPQAYDALGRQIFVTATAEF